MNSLIKCMHRAATIQPSADRNTDSHKMVLTTFLNDVKIICTASPVRKSNYKKRMTAFLINTVMLMDRKKPIRELCFSTGRLIN